MVPLITLNALSSGLGHFGVALNHNYIRHIDTYGAIVNDAKTNITCFVRSSESSDVLNILKNNKELNKTDLKVLKSISKKFPFFTPSKVLYLLLAKKYKTIDYYKIL